MPFTTKTLRCNSSFRFTHGDVEGFPANSSEVQPDPESINPGFGQTGKPSLRGGALLRFGERSGTTVSGLGIPARAIIDTVNLDYVAADTNAQVFNADFNLINYSNTWDSTGVGSTDVYYRPLQTTHYLGQNSTSDFGFYINFDLGALFEVYTTASTHSISMFSGNEGNPTVLGNEIFVLAATSGTLRNAGVRLNKTGTASPDYDCWLELWERGGDLLPTNMLAESDHISFNSLVTSGTAGANYTVFEFSGDDAIVVDPHADTKIWILMFKGDKKTTAGSETMDVGMRNDNPSVFLIPGCSGIVQDGFSRDIYPYQEVLPNPFQSNGNPRTEPIHGSTLSISSPAHVATTAVTVTGLNSLLQEWVDDDDYDITKPLCLSIGPGDAAAGDFHTITQTATTTNANDPILTVTYRKRKINTVT